MFFVLSVMIVAFVVYILFVSFNEAATLLHSNNNNGNVMLSPLISITKSPQGWLSRYIPMGSPTEELRQHEWLSQIPYGYPTVATTNRRKLFWNLLVVIVCIYIRLYCISTKIKKLWKSFKISLKLSYMIKTINSINICYYQNKKYIPI